MLDRPPRTLTRARLILILVAYTSFNFGVYAADEWRNDKKFLTTVINILTATFIR